MIRECSSHDTAKQREREFKSDNTFLQNNPLKSVPIEDHKNASWYEVIVNWLDGTVTKLSHPGKFVRVFTDNEAWD